MIQRGRWGGHTVMMCCGISERFRTELIVVPHNLIGIRYRYEILDPVAVPFVRCHNLVFQQDNARPHTARAATTFLQQHKVDTLPWPAFSPDMPLIEQPWDILDRRDSSRVPPQDTIALMQGALRKAWEAIPQQDLRRLVHCMRRRATTLIQATHDIDCDL